MAEVYEDFKNYLQREESDAEYTYQAGSGGSYPTVTQSFRGNSWSITLTTKSAGSTPGAPAPLLTWVSAKYENSQGAEFTVRDRHSWLRSQGSDQFQDHFLIKPDSATYFFRDQAIQSLMLTRVTDCHLRNRKIDNATWTLELYEPGELIYDDDLFAYYRSVFDLENLLLTRLTTVLSSIDSKMS